MKEILQRFFKERSTAFSWRRIWVFVIIIFVVFGMFFTAIVSYAHSYDSRVIPGVRIGNLPVGGMHRDELKVLLQDMNDKLLNEGITFSITPGEEQKEFTLYPVVVTETNSFELLHIDIDAEVEALIALGKEGDVFGRAFTVLESRIAGKDVVLKTVRAERERILETIDDFVAPYQTEAKDARIIIDSFAPFEYTMSSSSQGIVYQYDEVIDSVIRDWSSLLVPNIGELSVEVEEPLITKKDIDIIAPRLEKVFDDGSLKLSYTDSRTMRVRTWTIEKSQLAELLTVYDHPENGSAWALDLDLTSAYLVDTIGDTINVEAKDARFEVNSDGRVVAFQGSRPGIAFDIETTFIALNEALMQRTWHDEGITKTVQVATKQSEPIVKTHEVNELGISEVLGVGMSSYKGSPSNRIKNIKNALQKLNGILVAPGEEFSTIDHTKPYTIEGGYLPELVIKGDEIKPEIGGGLCQVGTTLFRMAMNSGMDITQRRNHSLVVNYYNDLTNGLPGTDATIYDPAPDFQFKNDTENYILIQAAMDEVNQDLIFTIWGTSDGRDASYTPPVVSRWIPYGETRVVETTKLEPGVRQCQHAYRGADTSFTYTRILGDGTEENTVFESHYRPLQQICLVGIEEDIVEVGTDCLEGEECVSVDAPVDLVSDTDVSNAFEE
jgi:vancomycin resistance protein YoaR